VSPAVLSVIDYNDDDNDDNGNREDDYRDGDKDD